MKLRNHNHSLLTLGTKLLLEIIKLEQNVVEVFGESFLLLCGVFFLLVLFHCYTTNTLSTTPSGKWHKVFGLLPDLGWTCPLPLSYSLQVYTSNLWEDVLTKQPEVHAKEGKHIIRTAHLLFHVSLRFHCPFTSAINPCPTLSLSCVCGPLCRTCLSRWASPHGKLSLCVRHTEIQQL